MIRKSLHVRSRASAGPLLKPGPVRELVRSRLGGAATLVACLALAGTVANGQHLHLFGGQTQTAALSSHGGAAAVAAPKGGGPPVAAATAQPAGKLKSVVLQGLGMDCNACSIAVKTALGGIKGIVSVDVDTAKDKVTIVYDPAQLDMSAIRNAIIKAGFKAGS